jgi:hypothetical protein
MKRISLSAVAMLMALSVQAQTFTDIVKYRENGVDVAKFIEYCDDDSTAATRRMHLYTTDRFGMETDFIIEYHVPEDSPLYHIITEDTIMMFQFVTNPKTNYISNDWQLYSAYVRHYFSPWQRETIIRAAIASFANHKAWRVFLISKCRR